MIGNDQESLTTTGGLTVPSDMIATEKKIECDRVNSDEEVFEAALFSFR